MNLLHLKYAVEIAKVGSINKAAEVLYVAQPNLSRSIKELEAEIGIAIFERSSKGMVLTEGGKSFIERADAILKQLDEMENSFHKENKNKQKFSISVPRASYISDAFSKFSNKITKEPAEIVYNETNPLAALNNIADSDYKLAIVRFSERNEKNYLNLFKERNLKHELITEFTYKILCNADSEITKIKNLKIDDLKKFIEISHGDPYVPSVPIKEVMNADQMYNSDRIIYVFERGGQFDLVRFNPECYMWVSPIPRLTLSMANLALVDCEDNKTLYKDVLVYKAGYQFSKLDRYFIEQLYESMRLCFEPHE